MRVARIGCGAVLALALAGCAGGGSVSPSQPPFLGPSVDAIGIGVDNATTLDVSLVVNSVVVEKLAPHTADRVIPMSALPPLPWVVQVRAASGRVLVTMTASPGDVQGPAPTGQVHGGREAGVSLSCGQIYLWTGAVEPSWPAPGSGSPGDCAP
jgi:hypothetical protein